MKRISEVIDYRSIVSQGDIHLNGPVSRSEGGMPIGNGIMGSLVWTSPVSLRFQINRSDVFACNCTTNSFPERCTDYGYACGYVDVDFPSYTKDLFVPGNLKQHLSIWDGIHSLKTPEVSCKVVAWQNADIMMVNVNDRRSAVDDCGCIVRLRMMRPPFVRNRSHTAESSFDWSNKNSSERTNNDGPVLCQEFKEEDYLCSSALGIDIQGKPYRIVEKSDQELALYLKPGPGDFTIIIGSSAAFAEQAESLERVRKNMNKAAGTSFQAVVDENATFWQEYWKRGYIRLSSADGKAQVVGLHYMYYLYLMASCSRRGDFAPNYGGLIWSTKGDLRAWGIQFWWINMNHYYNWLFPANRMEILDPYFRMYYNMSDSLEIAARQQWGSTGIYIPETTWFDGLEEMPEEIAEEMRDLYLLRRSWETRSQAFMDYANLKHPQNARWNWKTYGRYIKGKWHYDERGHGCFGRVLHLLESGGKLGHLYWMRYVFSQDREWLENIGYRMIKGIAEFFRNFPNLRKDNDGVYHVHLVNDSETIWGATDSVGVMTAMHLIFPAAINASEVLGVDAVLRASWQEVYDHLAPLPVSSHPRSMAQTGSDEDPFYVRGLLPSDTRSDGASSIPLVTDLCTLETACVDPVKFELAMNTYRKIFPDGFTEKGPLPISRDHHTRAMANLGLKQDLRHALYNQAICNIPRSAKKKTGDELYAVEDKVAFENRMTMVEGYNAIDAQRLGIVAGALHVALLQDSSGTPHGDPVMRVFPTCPDEWDADFKLLARGGFLVSASRRNGGIKQLEFVSTHGGILRIRNPWPGETASITINSDSVRETSDHLISLDTRKDDLIAFWKNDAAASEKTT